MPFSTLPVWDRWESNPQCHPILSRADIPVLYCPGALIHLSMCLSAAGGSRTHTALLGPPVSKTGMSTSSNTTAGVSETLHYIRGACQVLSCGRSGSRTLAAILAAGYGLASRHIATLSTFQSGGWRSRTPSQKLPWFSRPVAHHCAAPSREREASFTCCETIPDAE